MLWRHRTAGASRGPRKGCSDLKSAEPRPKAYSYIRFSSPEQAHGDSLRRQTEAARAYAVANDLDLDETLTFHDPAMSAYRGRNAEVGALGTFLEAVRDKIVPQGSYLLVESLDRVSRQTVRKAVRTMEEIVAAGVNLVDLSDGGRRYSVETLDSDHGVVPADGHAVYERARRERVEIPQAAGGLREQADQGQAARDAGEPFTRMLPAWLKWQDAKYMARSPSGRQCSRVSFRRRTRDGDSTVSRSG